MRLLQRNRYTTTKERVVELNRSQLLILGDVVDNNYLNGVPGVDLLEEGILVLRNDQRSRTVSIDSRAGIRDSLLGPRIEELGLVTNIRHRHLDEAELTLSLLLQELRANLLHSALDTLDNKLKLAISDGIPDPAARLRVG